MKKDRSLRAMALVAIFISVLGLAIGYSALQQTLVINAKTKVKSADWSVHFDTATLSEPTLVGSASVLTAANVAVTNINVDVSVVQPNDSVTYIFDVVNDGTLDAKLSSDPTLTGISEATAANVTFSLTYNDGTEIKANDTLNAGTSRKLKLVVSMNNVDTVADEDINLNLSATLLYVQK